MSRPRWQELPERGSASGIALLTMLFRFGGLPLMRLVLLPVAGYYLLTHAVARRASLAYLARQRRHRARLGQRMVRGGWIGAFRHIYSFAVSLAEKYAAWHTPSGRFRLEFEDDTVARALLDGPGGALLLVSHLGNFDVAIAHGALETARHYHILMDQQGTGRFNRQRLRSLPSGGLTFHDVDEIGPDLAITLREAVRGGAIVVIAADRLGDNPTASVPVRLLGETARLPTGPWVVAHLLRCPVFALFTCRERDHHRMLPHFVTRQVQLGDRRARDAQIARHAQCYAGLLESVMLRFPLQWYNFYPYWDEDR